MSTTTTNLNMVLNEGQDKFSIPTLNENLTKIDTAIGEQNKNFEWGINSEIAVGKLSDGRTIYRKYISTSVTWGSTSSFQEYTIQHDITFSSILAFSACVNRSDGAISYPLPYFENGELSTCISAIDKGRIIVNNKIDWAGYIFGIVIYYLKD